MLPQRIGADGGAPVHVGVRGTLRRGGPRFRRAWVIYLACAALSGTAWFGFSLRPELTIGTQALSAALLGLGFWAVKMGQGRWACLTPIANR